MNTQMRMLLTIATALTVVVGPALAGTPERLGTGGNPEARLLVGARTVGLAASNIASVEGVEAMFGNPAGLAHGDSRTEVLFSHANYIADMKLNYLALSQNMGTKGVLGLSVKVLSIGDIVRTTETAPCSSSTGTKFHQSARRPKSTPPSWLSTISSG